MTAVAFDTLKLARRLETAGFTRDQANGAAEALADSFSTEIATKSDLAELRAALDGRSSTIEASIAKLGAELRTEIASLRSSTAQWIISAALVNMVGVLGAVPAVWQLAHK